MAKDHTYLLLDFNERDNKFVLKRGIGDGQAEARVNATTETDMIQGTNDKPNVWKDSECRKVNEANATFCDACKDGTSAAILRGLHMFATEGKTSKQATNLSGCDSFFYNFDANVPYPSTGSVNWKSVLHAIETETFAGDTEAHLNEITWQSQRATNTLDENGLPYNTEINYSHYCYDCTSDSIEGLFSPNCTAGIDARNKKGPHQYKRITVGQYIDPASGALNGQVWPRPVAAGSIKNGVSKRGTSIEISENAMLHFGYKNSSFVFGPPQHANMKKNWQIPSQQKDAWEKSSVKIELGCGTDAYKPDSPLSNCIINVEENGDSKELNEYTRGNSKKNEFQKPDGKGLRKLNGNECEHVKYIAIKGMGDKLQVILLFIMKLEANLDGRPLNICIVTCDTVVLYLCVVLNVNCIYTGGAKDVFPLSIPNRLPSQPGFHTNRIVHYNPHVDPVDIFCATFQQHVEAAIANNEKITEQFKRLSLNLPGEIIIPTIKGLRRDEIESRGTLEPNLENNIKFIFRAAYKDCNYYVKQARKLRTILQQDSDVNFLPQWWRMDLFPAITWFIYVFIKAKQEKKLSLDAFENDYYPLNTNDPFLEKLKKNNSIGVMILEKGYHDDQDILTMEEYIQKELTEKTKKKKRTLTPTEVNNAVFSICLLMATSEIYALEDQITIQEMLKITLISKGKGKGKGKTVDQTDPLKYKIAIKDSRGLAFSNRLGFETHPQKYGKDIREAWEKHRHIIRNSDGKSTNTISDNIARFNVELDLNDEWAAGRIDALLDFTTSLKGGERTFRQLVRKVMFPMKNDLWSLYNLKKEIGFPTGMLVAKSTGSAVSSGGPGGGGLLIGGAAEEASMDVETSVSSLSSAVEEPTHVSLMDEETPVSSLSSAVEEPKYEVLESDEEEEKEISVDPEVIDIMKETLRFIISIRNTHIFGMEKTLKHGPIVPADINKAIELWGDREKGAGTITGEVEKEAFAMYADKSAEKAALMETPNTDIATDLNIRLKLLMEKPNNTKTFPILTFKKNYCDQLKNLLIFLFKNTNIFKKEQLTDANNFNEQEFIEDMQEVYDIIVALKKDDDNYNGYIKIGFPEDFQHYINILRATQKGVNNNEESPFNIKAALTFTDIIIRHNAINAFNIEEEEEEEGNYDSYMEELDGGGKQMYGGAPTSQQKKFIRDELVKLIIIDKLPILIDIYYPHVGSKAPANHYPDSNDDAKASAGNYTNFRNTIISDWIEANKGKPLKEILEGYQPPDGPTPAKVSQSQTTTPPSSPSSSDTQISPGVQAIRQWPDNDYLWEIVLDIFDKVFTIIKNTELSGMNIAEQYIESLVAKVEDKENPLIPNVLTNEDVDIDYEEFKQLLMAYIYSDNMEYVEQRLEPSTSSGPAISVVENPEGFSRDDLQELIPDELMPDDKTLEKYEIQTSGDPRYNPTILISNLPFNQVMLYGNNHHLAKNQEWAQMIIMGECQSFISTIVILLRQLALKGILPWEANVLQIIKTRTPSRFLQFRHKSTTPFATKLYEYLNENLGGKGGELLDTINRITFIVTDKTHAIDFADYLGSIYELNSLKYIKELEAEAAALTAAEAESKTAEDKEDDMDEKRGGGVYELKGGMYQSDEEDELPNVPHKNQSSVGSKGPPTKRQKSPPVPPSKQDVLNNVQRMKRPASDASDEEAFGSEETRAKRRSPTPDELEFVSYSSLSTDVPKEDKKPSDIFFEILNKDESAAQHLEIFNNFETVLPKMWTSKKAPYMDDELVNEMFPGADPLSDQVTRAVTMSPGERKKFSNQTDKSSSFKTGDPASRTLSASFDDDSDSPGASASSMEAENQGASSSSTDVENQEASQSSMYAESPPRSPKAAPVTPSPNKSIKKSSPEEGGSKKKKTRRRKKKKKTKRRRSKNNTKTRSNRRKKRSKGKKRRNNRRS